MERHDLIARVAGAILETERDHPVRVGIDGVDAAGKTTLAEELAQFIRAEGHSVIRTSIDGFHNPRSIRCRRGPDSPAGYFDDSFDYSALVTNLLTPLGPGGSRTFRRRVFDHRTDSYVHADAESIRPEAVLLFDGVFLLRSELRPHWDFTVFVHADFETILERAQRRDAPMFGSPAKARERYLRRYVPGQRIYLRRCRPRETADMVIDNNDPARPFLVER